MSVFGTLEDQHRQGRRTAQVGEVARPPSRAADDGRAQPPAMLRQRGQGEGHRAAIGMTGGVDAGRIDAPLGRDLCRQARELIHRHRTQRHHAHCVGHDETLPGRSLGQACVAFREPTAETCRRKDEQQSVRLSGVVVARGDHAVRQSLGRAACMAPSQTGSCRRAVLRRGTGIARVRRLDRRTPMQDARSEDCRQQQHQPDRTPVDAKPTRT